MVYFDHAATTPMTGRVLDTFHRELRRRGNPASLHSSGRQARMVVDQARQQLAQAIGAHPSEVIFTSGGTEADNLAVKGLYWARRRENPQRNKIVVSAIEHPAVRDTVEWLVAEQNAEALWAPVTAEGALDHAAYQEILAEHAETIALVTVMWANNEVGTIQDMPGIVESAKSYGIPVHSDAVQAFGAVPVNFATSGLAALSISAHKIGGPVGAGALILDRKIKLTPVQHGGGQERDVRSGTVDSAGIAAFAEAAQEATEELASESARLAGLRDALITGVQQNIPEAVLRGPHTPGSMSERLPGNVLFTFPGCEGDSLLFLLDQAGFETSTGSACTAGVPRPSQVLLAMGVPEVDARGAQRFSLGHSNTEADVHALVSVLPAVYAQAKIAGMAHHVSTITSASTR